MIQSNGRLALSRAVERMELRKSRGSISMGLLRCQIGHLVPGLSSPRTMAHRVRRRRRDCQEVCGACIATYSPTRCDQSSTDRPIRSELEHALREANLAKAGTTPKRRVLFDELNGKAEHDKVRLWILGADDGRTSRAAEKACFALIRRVA